MHRDLVDILACPLCKKELRLDVSRGEGGEVIDGSLTCTACGEVYPIAEGIPNLLPPDLRREMETQSGAPTGH